MSSPLGSIAPRDAFGLLCLLTAYDDGAVRPDGLGHDKSSGRWRKMAAMGQHGLEIHEDDARALASYLRSRVDAVRHHYVMHCESALRHRFAREAPAFMPGRDGAAREACHVIALRIQPR